MDLAREIELLNTKIKMLEEENISLSQNLEDLLLVNILNNQPAKINDVNFYLDSILEKLSILKSLPFAAVLKVEDQFLKVVSHYASDDDTDRTGLTIDLNSISANHEDFNPKYLIKEEYRTFLRNIELPESSIDITEIVFYPFIVDNLGKFYLLIIDHDLSGSRLKSLESNLYSFISNLKVRIENIKLNDELKSINAGLESKVEERTTELNEINEKLKTNEQFLRSIIENEPGCIKILGPEGNLIYMNPAGLRMIEVENLEQVKGACVYPLILPENRDAFVDITNRVFKGERGNLQFQMMGLKGTKLWLETSAVPLYDNHGKVESLLGLTQNITERKEIEEVLKKSEQKYRLLFENMTTGFALHEIICDDQGNPIDYRYLEANRAFEELTGIKVTDIEGRTVKELLPKIEPYWIEVFGNVALTGESIAYENYEAEIGKYFDTWVFSPRIGQFAVVFNDITKRKKAEISLGESEKRLTLIFNSTPLMIFLLDSNIRISKINKAVLTITEKHEEHVIGLRVGQILNCSNSVNSIEGCGNGVNCQLCKIHNSILYTLETHESIYKIEAKISMGRAENVFERNVLLSTEYIEIEGKPSVFLSIDDITERVQLENVLREKKSILVKAQELAKIGEFHHDYGSNIFRLSPNLEKITGFNRSSISFEELLERIHPEDKENTLDYFENAKIIDNKLSIQFRIYKPDGELLHLFIQAEIERDENGKAIKTFGVVMDNSEQKKSELELTLKNYELRATEEELIATNDALRDNIVELEAAKVKAEESDRLKSAFLANMSHEIRTPMNAIMGFADLLDLEDMPFEKRKKFTTTIRERTKDLLNIINDLLDISRLESHTLKIIETKGNINTILNDIKDFFEIRNSEIYTKPIAFNLFNELLPDQCIIETDFERIKQVLINLVENAFKFTSAGSISLGCKIIDNKTILFSVTDTGIGISKEKQNLIFERFRQVDDSYLTREFGGAGLGLSISKGIVELMNGSIWVESELEKGATFYFTVPYKSTNNQVVGIETGKSSKFNFGQKTILIVEDIDYNQDYLREILEDTNAILIFASDGATALEKFMLHPEIEIVLMDIRLPDIHGLELTRIMLSEKPEMKIIAQTAYASSEDQAKCNEAGCIDFISKPISQNILLETLHKYLIQ